ncbi:unnamed protein product [Paramecium pentaurelia]|uniref:Uncharacterized protein n=1 Tax=Paramecium pentaurelia TaxID=43138 RepID=A0A8S1S1C0_9CILI|nr:unnamed protein product [Paramecium pentaurelia]
MKTRRSQSVQPSYQSEEEYIEKNMHVCKSVHPQLTFRQIRNKLSSEWNVLNNKPKKQTKLDDFIIQISPSSPISKTIQKKKSKKQLKQKLQLHNNKNNIPPKNLNQKKTKNSHSLKQGPTIVISDSESFKISLTSQDDKQSILKDSPIVISNNSLQNKEVNQKLQKNQIKSKSEKEESKQNSIKHQKISKQKLKPNRKLHIKKLKLRRQNKLRKLISNNKSGIASDFQPVLVSDFINSTKKQDHISLITISKSKVEQGQVGLDEIKNIVSHTYGIINHEYNNSEILNFQLFFEVEFQPRNDGHVIQNTFCTTKQAAFYCKNLVLEYIQKHKDIFTQNDDYYLQ